MVVLVAAAVVELELEQLQQVLAQPIKVLAVVLELVVAVQFTPVVVVEVRRKLV
jgi:hypothetical protein